MKGNRGIYLLFL